MVLNEKEIREKYGEYIIKIRRHIHENPELSYQEFETSRLVKNELDEINVSWRECGLETGVLAEIKGGKPGKTILLRADMDALPVAEETGVSYASKEEGVMHACGHDNHTAMLLTAAHILNDNKEGLCGTVKLAFQPAEEKATGAKAMIAEGALEGVDHCFGMHVWSDVEAGTVSCIPGPMMASGDQFWVTVKGKGGHGSAPHECIDAIQVGCSIVEDLQAIVSRQVDPQLPTVVTVGKFTAGSAFNIIADTADIEGTVRCYSNEVWRDMPGRIEKMVRASASVFGADIDFKYSQLTPVVENDPYIAGIVNEAARKDFGEDGIAPPNPVMGSEDFAFFMEKVPGALAFLGIRNEKCDAVWPQHNPHYNVDEDALIRGAMLYAQVAIDHNEQ